MKELLLQYAEYNAWANRLYIDVLSQLSEKQLDMAMVSSFPSIRKTVAHMWSAEDIWLQRLLLTEQTVWAEANFRGDFAEMLARWKSISATLCDFVSKQFADASFQHIMQYNNLKGEPVKLPVYIALMQAFNHASYHRGQLITMLRQAGVTRLPASDFHIFATA